jgi:glutamate-ammonia-ligase adenylyltransferase
VTLALRLREALGPGPLATTLAVRAEPFLERRAKDLAAGRLGGPVLSGLARVLATSADAARFLSRRPRLLERIAEAGPRTLEERGRTLLAEARGPQAPDLETALDELRVLRREETLLAACLDLGDLLPFERVSDFLSCLAEAITERALRLAAAGEGLGVVALGKLAGRELTYYSDLDLIFLVPDQGPLGAPEASRRAQRLIAYLGTPTGAGVAYAVDARLRPSGRQGTLVSTFSAYQRYQCREAATWEHLALLRARAIAGELDPTATLLGRVRRAVLGVGRRAWGEVDAMRRRVVIERPAAAGHLPLKTGLGGIMDVDFLAAGGLLERGSDAEPRPLPSIPAMLAAASSSSRTLELARDYGWLRRVEARARWLGERAVESFPESGPLAAALAELVEPGLGAERLAARAREVMARVAAAYDAVIAAGTFDALD